VIDLIEQFLQIEIDAPAVAFGDVLMRLCHCLRDQTIGKGHKVAVQIDLKKNRELACFRVVVSIRNVSQTAGPHRRHHRSRALLPTELLAPYYPDLEKIVVDYRDQRQILALSSITFMHPATPRNFLKFLSKCARCSCPSIQPLHTKP
jgi:hypothetical protein